MPDAAYYRAWRAAHPEYRARERERLRARKRAGGSHGDRAAQRQRHRERERQRRGENGHVLSHPLLDEARALARTKVRVDGRTHVTDCRYDDLVGVIALALCERKCPHAAAREWLHAEWQWSRFVVQEPRENEA